MGCVVTHDAASAAPAASYIKTFPAGNEASDSAANGFDGIFRVREVPKMRSYHGMKDTFTGKAADNHLGGELEGIVRVRETPHQFI